MYILHSIQTFSKLEFNIQKMWSFITKRCNVAADIMPK